MKKANIMKSLFGSHLYGLDTPQSDFDYKGIYLPTLDELLLGNYKPTIVSSTGNSESKNSKDDVDYELVSLPKFLKLCCKNDTMAIDLLHSSEFEKGEFSWVFDELKDRRKEFYSKNMSSLIGYLKHQSAKYGVKGSRMSSLKNSIQFISGFNPSSKLSDNQLFVDDIHVKVVDIPQKNNSHIKSIKYYEILGKKFVLTMTAGELLVKLNKWYEEYGERARLAEKNNGVDWKAVSHALRAGYQVIDIFKKGDFNYPLDQTDYIKSVKSGSLDFKTDVMIELENVVDLSMKLSHESKLQNCVDNNIWDEWLLSVYRKCYEI